jgi:hypothetical protein
MKFNLSSFQYRQGFGKRSKTKNRKSAGPEDFRPGEMQFFEKSAPRAVIW